MTSDGLLQHLPAQALEHIASYFRTLSETTRLRILNVLRAGPCSVGEIAEKVESSPANVSRHLLLPAQQGLVLQRGRSVHLCPVRPGLQSVAQRWEAHDSQREAFDQARKQAKKRGGSAKVTSPLLPLAKWQARPCSL